MTTSSNWMNQKSKFTLASGVRRPNWVSSNSHQLVILVRDNSISMSGEKANDATSASNDLLSELALPINKDAFEVCVIDFGSDAEIVNSPQKATAMVNCLSNLLGDGGSTNIVAGLEHALNIVELAENKIQAGVIYLKPVVVLFTDGCQNTGGDARSIADQLKGKADLVAVAFGSDADEYLLQDLASSPQHFYRCSTGKELRKFMATVGATLSATMVAGKNASNALASL